MIKGVSFFTTKSATLACSSPNEKIVKGSQKDRQYNGKKTEGQTIQWQKDRRTDNTMAKRQKDRQYNGKKKRTKKTKKGFRIPRGNQNLKENKRQTMIYKILHKKLKIA
jgi:hypothetical protein